MDPVQQAFDRLQEAVGTERLSTLLEQAAVLAGLVADRAFQEWVNRERHGYPEPKSTAELPHYRRHIALVKRFTSRAAAQAGEPAFDAIYKEVALRHRAAKLERFAESYGGQEHSFALTEELDSYYVVVEFDPGTPVVALAGIRAELASWLARLQLQAGEQRETRAPSAKVFVVHGHDRHALALVESFLFRLGFEPIVLFKKTNQGRAIIEKFEQSAAEATFAVVLLTPDDVGGKAAEPGTQLPRARQNVVFELGYFVGKLGRGNVCPLYKEGVELPSDFHGVGYVEMDEDDHWQLELAKEMRAAGLPVDMNRI